MENKFELDTQLNSEQVANLTKLADYLESLPDDYPHFKMLSYMADYNGNQLSVEYDLGEADGERILNCGTSACAVGHGPYAGVEPSDGEDWEDYERRAFGISQLHPNFEAWDYAFGPTNDDDAKAAATRIREVLEARP